jgi:lysozyme
MTEQSQLQRDDLTRLEGQLQRHEGFRSHPYRCSAGRLTIGYGRNLDDRGVSEDEAEYLLRNDVDHAMEDARSYAGASWDGLNGPRRAVLVNMAFNLGMSRLLGFVRLRERLTAGDYHGAAEEMQDSAWAHQVGSRARELAEQMRTGEWAMEDS